MILIDLSEKIDPSIVEAIDAVNSVAGTVGVSFFVVGARARDIILEGIYNISSIRVTLDIDLGIEVNSWEDYRILVDEMISSGKFIKGTNVYRFTYGGLIVDILPFGDIVGDDGRISWPPEHEIFMSMLGFQEAYQYSTVVRIRSSPELDIKVPTLAGLVLMKMIAWKEKGFDPIRKKDAKDIYFIITKYEEAGNQDRLYDREADLLVEENFDMKRASARLLGRDISAMSSPEALDVVKGILVQETQSTSSFHLVGDIVEGSVFGGDQFQEVLSIVECMKIGVLEGKK